MAKAQKIRFVATGERGRFQFHDGDGRLHVVDADGFETSDPGVVALLDGAPHVKREAKSGKKKPAAASSSSSSDAEPAADAPPADDGGGS
jgi:hypothetical protein